MGRADVSRGEQIPFRNVPELGQRSENVSESMNNDGRHVLQVHDAGSNVANDSCDVGPQPAVIIDPALSARDTERLAGETGNEAIHAAAPRSAIEGDNVTPDNRRMKDAFCHSRDQMRGDKGFPLHVTDGGGAGHGEFDGELESAGPGEQSEDGEGR